MNVESIGRHVERVRSIGGFDRIRFDARTDSRVVGADLPAAVRASAERMRARAAEYRRIVEDPAGLRDKAFAYNATIDAVRAAYAGFTEAERDLLDIAYPDVSRLRI